MSSRDSVLFRRNGKPQSCEPCRKSKVRCDHKAPVCDRCVARGVEEKCVYHPAPLTKVTAKASSSPLRTPRLTPRATPVPRTPQSMSSSSLGHARRTLLTTRATPAEAEFLGSTSFSAIIEDDRDIVNQHTETIPAQEMVDEVDTLKTHIPEERITAGITVLKLLAEAPNMKENIHRYYGLSYTQMVPAPFINACVESIHKKFTDSSNWTNEDWRKQVISLFENTYKTLKLFTPIRAQDYHTLFTGDNLRFEIVGFVLAILGVALKYDYRGRSEVSPGLTPQRSDLVQRIVNGVQYCVTVCHSCNSVNYQILWLLYGQTCFNTLVYGDMSFEVWRNVGDLSSLFFALGLHEDVKHTSSHLFYECELRRRYAAQIFAVDKTISTLLGRPPRISGRYCVNVIPLDIDDATLLLEGEELQEALSNIDENGWNTDGGFRNSTWRRVKLITCQLREEVLEVCLGRNQNDIDRRARDILARHKKAWEQIPSQVKYDELTQSEHIPPPQRYIMMMSYMDQKHNRFLLQRKLVKDTQCSREYLYKISMSLLSAVLQVISLSDQFYSMQKDISWIILYYGLPSASIIAVDLLRQSGAAYRMSSVELDVIPRAQAIRNLSVFVSNLQRTVDRREVNEASCRWAGRVLSCILDEIIDPKQRVTSSEEPSGTAVANIPLPSSEEMDQNPINVDDFLNWVEEVDWNLETSTFMM